MNELCLMLVPLVYRIKQPIKKKHKDISLKIIFIFYFYLRLLWYFSFMSNNLFQLLQSMNILLFFLWFLFDVEALDFSGDGRGILLYLWIDDGLQKCKMRYFFKLFFVIFQCISSNFIWISNLFLDSLLTIYSSLSQYIRIE